ncbi:MAG: nucleotidyl transferase AbiEii/AbiGii toxin family protein [Eggerthellaceae bacterium]|nr:nucleotidyl transferase AbiEii/AbiGii toxin family protein [Eggerthellaceae bacterium]
MFLHENPEELAQLVTSTAIRFERAEAYILKDYFATMVLREVVSRNPRVVFKGGTCLSKCHHAIDRFSEDVDLGMAEDRVTEGMRKALKRAVTESANALGLGIANIDQTRSRRDYNRYDMALPGGDKLIVETAVITPASPASPMPVQSFIGEYCDLSGLHGITEEYGLEPFEVNANSMERTLCDKAFALCDYYLAGEELRRHSRHIYDLRKLQAHVSFDEGLAALFAAVRKQRHGNPRCLSAEPGVDLAGVLRELADGDVYKRDYLDVTVDLLYDEMPYEEAVKALREVAEFVDGIDWDA